MKKELWNKIFNENSLHESVDDKEIIESMNTQLKSVGLSKTMSVTKINSIISNTQNSKWPEYNIILKIKNVLMPTTGNYNPNYGGRVNIPRLSIFDGKIKAD